MILCFDFETTGFPAWKEASDLPHQPHWVQVGAILCDPASIVLDVLDVIVKPDGWVIKPEVAAIHGITTERAMDEGIPEIVALGRLLAMSEIAAERSAHNESFDRRIMRIAMCRYIGKPEAQAWEAAHKVTCTANATTALCKLPPTPKMLAAGFRKYKTPTMAESYRHLFGEEPAGQHTALGDAIAVRRILFKLRGIDVEPFPPVPVEQPSDHATI